MSTPAPTRQLFLHTHKMSDPDRPSKMWWQWAVLRGEDTWHLVDVAVDFYETQRDALADGRLALAAWQFAEEELLDRFYDAMGVRQTDFPTLSSVLAAMTETARDRRRAGIGPS